MNETNVVAVALGMYNDGYNKGVMEERERIINIIENCCWRDSDMLVELINEEEEEQQSNDN